MQMSYSFLSVLNVPIGMGGNHCLSQSASKHCKSTEEFGDSMRNIFSFFTYAMHSKRYS